MPPPAFAFSSIFVALFHSLSPFFLWSHALIYVIQATIVVLEFDCLYRTRKRSFVVPPLVARLSHPWGRRIIAHGLFMSRLRTRMYNRDLVAL